MKKILVLSLLAICGCAEKVVTEVSKETIKAGTAVMIKGNNFDLEKTNTPLLLNSSIINYVGLIGETDSFKGKVSIINIVPSIDTAVCEEQTHILGEDKAIGKAINRVTISRDLPMAQKRFARDGKLENIKYYSDFKNADFGKKTGLLIKEKGLLARGVLVTDRAGVVKHMQIVPDATLMPDMKMAIEIANKLDIGSM